MYPKDLGRNIKYTSIKQFILSAHGTPRVSGVKQSSLFPSSTYGNYVGYVLWIFSSLLSLILLYSPGNSLSFATPLSFSLSPVRAYSTTKSYLQASMTCWMKLKNFRIFTVKYLQESICIFLVNIDQFLEHNFD